MKHKIDPTVDCVFKALLGSESNKNLLVHFLNAVLSPPPSKRIVAVTILNPFNERDFENDKLTVVDVKAEDSQGTIYQVEVQLLVYEGLIERVVYTWADCFTKQLTKGRDYVELKPVIAIWLICGVLLREEDVTLATEREQAASLSVEGAKRPHLPAGAYHHQFEWWDHEKGVKLGEMGAIHLLELKKWHKAQVEGELDRWVQFFRDGKLLDDEALPGYMETPEMKQAMETLREFSEREKRYDVYRRRRDYLVEQATIRNNLLRAEQKMQVLEQEKQAALQETRAAHAARQVALEEKQAIARQNEALLAEMERLRQLAANAGVVLPTSTDPSKEP